jgi:hypothetical protein
MNVKQLHEILGKYIDIGAGEWVVLGSQREQFKTRKEHRECLKSNPPRQSVSPFVPFVVGEVRFAEAVEDGVRTTPLVVLFPSFFIKDENRAFYYLPPEEFLKVDMDTPLPRKRPPKLEVVAKASKGSKKGTQKSAKTTKGSKKK